MLVELRASGLENMSILTGMAAEFRAPGPKSEPLPPPGKAMPSPHLRKHLWLAVFLALFSLSQVRDAAAQATHQLEIHYPEVTEGASAMSLGLYFTVLDAGGQVLTDAKVIDAEVALGDGSTYDAAVAKPSPETQAIVSEIRARPGSSPPPPDPARGCPAGRS